MPYVLTVDVTTTGAPAPARSVIEFGLPPGGTDADALIIARGIRAGFRSAFSARVVVVSFEETGLTRSIDLTG